MNYLILIIVGMVGIVLGYYFAQDGGKKVSKQKFKKEKIEKKILLALNSSAENKITNDDVEELLGVSNTTAERYLDELEKEEKIKQNGKTGRSVFYTLK